MKRIPLLLAAVLSFSAVSAIAHAQSVDTATLIPFHGGPPSQIAMPSAALTLHDVFGIKGADVALRPFGGFTIDSGFRPGAGVIGSIRVNFAANGFADLGLYGRGQVGRQVDSGICFAVGLRF